MLRDLRPNDIDWIFCWRTSTGEVSPGARDVSLKLGSVRYQPAALGNDAGLRTVVHGRLQACSRPPTGPRLDEPGGISRGSLFVWGYVTHAFLIPARTGRELTTLQAAAHAAVLSGDATEWALAAILAGGRVYWAIHLGARPEVVAELATRIQATRTLEVREKQVGSWVKGAQILSRDLDGRVASVLAADTLFDEAPLPLFDTRWTEGAIASDPFATDEAPTVRQEVSSVRPVSIPDEDVEEDVEEHVIETKHMRRALLESVGVDVGESSYAGGRV